MAIRAILSGGAAAVLLLAAGCEEKRSGPIVVSVIGSAPRLGNPNLRPMDAPSAFLAQATAQGLVRFDATGQVEPALAQSWIVSDDGLRYTFRLTRIEWSAGKPVTAEQVAARLRAAISRASSNVLKIQLGAIDEVDAMTGDVIEISLKGPRPNFLQLLAQPEMAIIADGRGTGPYRAERQRDGAYLLSAREAYEDVPDDTLPPLILRGERAGMAVARFTARQADLVLGGTAGNLPVARAADLPATALHFEPVSGLFGLTFVRRSGPIADASVRRALAMALDRGALLDEYDVPGLRPRETLVPGGVAELPKPALPDWNGLSADQRRLQAQQAIGAATDGSGPLTLRVAMPDDPGYRAIFAHLRRDWRAIGVETVKVAANADADLRLIDSVAPIQQAAWYLRQFDCAGPSICVAEADDLLDKARSAPTAEERQQALAAADLLLTAATPFISIGAPVRWALVSQRITAFQANAFAQRFAGSLIAAPR